MSPTRIAKPISRRNMWGKLRILVDLNVLLDLLMKRELFTNPLPG